MPQPPLASLPKVLLQCALLNADGYVDATTGPPQSSSNMDAPSPAPLPQKSEGCDQPLRLPPESASPAAPAQPALIKSNSPRLNIIQQLATALQSHLRIAHLLANSSHSQPIDRTKRPERVNSSMAQMVRTSDTKKRRQRGGNVAEDYGGQECRHNRHDEGDFDFEPFGRWLSYVLKSGHDMLNVQVSSDGWAEFEELAQALYRDMPFFGLDKGAALRELVIYGDMAGRFEVDGSRVRKVARKDRVPVSKKWVANTASTTMGVDEEKPDPPPGEYWTKFRDVTNEPEQFWYFYDGPLGRWWVEDKPPYDVQPYNEED